MAYINMDDMHDENETLLHVVEERDAYAAENAALRTQLAAAQQWTPVSDADYRENAHTVLHIGGDGEWIGISHNNGVGIIRRNTVQLPATLRLCRRTQPAEVQP